ncbi:hypothetical protein [Streptomyces tritici]|uniref:hypothetical protein n=1 Tax=Streptomyces tritici TaxID=2054410 RepID=UPI003AF1AE70
MNFDLTAALTTGGIALEDLTSSALLHFGMEFKRLGVTHGSKAGATRFAGLGTWQVLHTMGHFPPGTPPTLRAYVYRGQLTVAQLVNRYPIQHQGVRQLLIDYLLRRRGGTDYTTHSSESAEPDHSLRPHFSAPSTLRPTHPGEVQRRTQPCMPRMICLSTSPTLALRVVQQLTPPAARPCIKSGS